MVERDENGQVKPGSVLNPNGRPTSIPGITREDRRRESKYIKRYGISTLEYIEIFIKQNGVCAICGNPETKTLLGIITNLSVDHDHITGDVRGLLCYRCNTGIGKLRDNSDLLRKAADYLDSKKRT